MTAGVKTAQMPEVAPKGFLFYLATTPNQTDKGRRYLHSIHRPDKPFGELQLTLSPTRSLAKPFDRLALACAYADFLKRTGVIDTCVILERGGVMDGQSFHKVNQREGRRSRIERHSEFTWK